MGSLNLPRYLALDANVLIYHLESPDSPEGAWLRAEVFDEPRSLISSSLGLTELLVGPARSGGGRAVGRARAALTLVPGLVFVSVDERIAVVAAQIRARTGLRLADSVHAATATLMGADLLLTNDRTLARTPLDVRTLYLAEMLAP